MLKPLNNSLFFLCFFITNLFAQQENKLPSTIEAVTVFTKGAQITRTARAAVPAGNNTLVFTGLSPMLLTESIQVNGKGDFTILSVNHQFDFLEEPEKTERVKELEIAVKEMELALKREKVGHKVLEEEEKLILNNNKVAGSQNGLVLSELQATAGFYRQRLKEIKLEKIAIMEQVREKEEALARYKAQLKELVDQKKAFTSEVVVKTNAERAINADFTLKYAVGNAGWFANYDLRVKDVASPVNLAYKAILYQNSGEDWKDVTLTLSTGDFSKTGEKPELEPWLLDYYADYAGKSGMNRNQVSFYAGNELGGRYVRGIGGRVSGYVRDESGEPLIGASILVQGTNIGTITDINGFYELDVPPYGKKLIVSYTGFDNIEADIQSAGMDIGLREGVVLEEVVVLGYGVQKRRAHKRKRSKEQTASKPLAQTVTERVTTIEFKIELPYTIPSDGKQHIVQVARHEVPATYQYYTVPKLDNDAFLTAQVTDWEDFHLLNGEANLFFEGTFLGKSFLDVQVADDTLNLSLGRDKDIVVTRTKVREFSKKKFLGKNRVASRAYELELKNKKQQAVSIVLEDQLPLSARSEIEVADRKFDGAEHDEKTGMLKWRMMLQPGEIKKTGFGYTVKYPKDVKLDLD